jgi:multiple sugar transport system permease protein
MSGRQDGMPHSLVRGRSAAASVRSAHPSSAVVADPPAGRAAPWRGIGRLGWFDRHFAAVTVGPAVIVSLLVFGLPLAFSLWLSLQGWSMEQSLFGGRFVGLQYYSDLFADPAFTDSLVRTLVYTVITVGAELGFGLGIALLLNVDIPYIALFRTALIVPMMMTPIVAALCWKMLLDPQYGVIDYLIGSPIIWLGHPTLAFIAVAFVNVWQNAPYVAILLLAGLRSLPLEPVEAAAIDGASRVQVFLHVTLPLLKPYLVVALLLRTIFEFRSFDNAYVMTGGGPADATSLLSIYTYITSFQSSDMSLAAASSWVMLAIALAFCLAFVLVIRRRDAH